ncbi:zinc finger CCCH domain-containing protein 7A isoform X3 [Larimichthys crocea]|uniref:zinc finger CCCH domain-containing protein 7A isoform X3 n=1 Tax=Larimichthys crocea TaxID=215358 RepID=UPI000F5E356E|nr:zinc finger CCCH domain-containing protein 7A isoform X3 [Larimichthys crocea]
MSGPCQDRRIRWQEIQKGLQFIQSTLPFPGSQEQYEVFIKELVWNLFGEGNDVFKEGEWTKSIEMYTEALSIADYADSEEICVPTGLLEKLYANRAAAYLNIVPGLYDQALEDCEKALQLNEGNYRALYRKARSLKELGRHQEAYEAVAKCSLAVPQDSFVTQLTQDLAKLLGLKIRKAYPALNVLRGSSYQDASCDKFSHGSSSVDSIEIEVPQLSQDSGVVAPVPAPIQAPVPVHSPLSEAAVDELPPNNSVSSVTPSEPPGFESVHLPVSVPTSVPLPVPTFVNGCRTSKPCPLLETSQDFAADIIGDDLDDLLDQAGPKSPLVIPTVKGPLPLPTSIASGSSMSSPFLMPSHMNPFLSSSQQCTVTLPPLYHKSGSSTYFGMDTFDTLPTSLDALDSLTITDFKDYAPTPFIPQLNNNDAPMGMAVGMPEVKGLPTPVGSAKNPLAETHEFKQACSVCYVKTGPGVLDYTLHTEEHKCKKDALLGRIRPDKTWKLIRPRPTKTQYVGPYYICKEVAVGKECLYPGHCTFAYCQEEIDVWTLERKGFISRELLFDPYGPNSNVRLTVPKILQEHHGIFMFLCGVCFDHKPRIISKTNKDDPSLCSHPVTKHDFEDHKCLVHILKENTVRYSKIRPLSPQCQLDLCRHEVRYGCVREDDCFYAHSLIELKVWMMQHELGITHESIVQEAKKFWNATASLQGAQQLSTTQRRFGPPNLKMMFVCGQCWRNGQLSEADKNKKYCTAKARHTWAKDRRVVLVSSHERKKWTTVRPLPTKKPIPSQFEICMHVTAGKKCQYIGNCTFAHSVEERDLWTYMKENNIPDMDQLYEQWLQSQKLGWGEESSNNSVRENGKQIHMPTDYAEEVAGNHCWLCGKNCNSEKQWQQHITSEKHKDRVFNSEDDQNCWQYRFPTGTFKVCERYLKGTCTEDDLCKLAHGVQELKEWMERREFLSLKLAKARKDHLIAPNDNDFGKYSFLLKDIM